MDKKIPPNLPMPYISDKEEYVAKTSFSQQRMWFLNQTVDKKSSYHIPFAIKMPSDFRRDYLEKAFNDIIIRHDVLRTTFEIDNGELIQVIHPISTYQIKEEEYSEIYDDIIGTIVSDFSNQEFDLENGPCFRSKIVSFKDGHHILLLVFHHIIFDGHSQRLFFNELLERYEAFVNSRVSSFTKLKIQYGDYSEWQNEWVNSANAEKQIDFWKDRTFSTKINLPSTLDNEINDGVVKRKISKEILNNIDLFSRGFGITRYMFILTSFIVLIQRYTKNEKIVIGMPIANRDKIETEELIGLMLNTSVLDIQIEENMTFKEILNLVKSSILNVYDNSNIPFERLLEFSNLKEDSKDHSFELFVNYEFSNHKNNSFGFKLINFDEANAKFPISFYIEDSSLNMNLRISYQSSKYSGYMIEILLQQLEHLIKDALKKPNKKIFEFEILSIEDYKVLPDPSIKIEEPQQRLLPELLHQVFKNSGDNNAISQGEETWNYKRLYQNILSIQIELEASNLEKGTPIGVFGERTKEYICTMIAIMCSGMIFVPIDKTLPMKKREEILSEIDMKNMFFTDENNLKISEKTFYNEFYTKEIIKKNHSSGVSINNNIKKTFDISTEDPAYIYFTSGTSGKPKGIIGKHKSLAHFLNWQSSEFNVKRGDRAAQLTNVSFDVFLRDTLLPLISGAELCIPDDTNDLSGEYLMRWLSEKRITIIHSVPSLANSWLTSHRNNELNDLRLIFFAGEPLTSQIINKLRNEHNYTGEIINLYGPSETTLAKSFYKVPVVTNHIVQPIGFPIKNTQLLIFKQNHLMCGIGEIGEIVIRTPFLTKGYIDKEAFILNPYGINKNDYIYYTGDLGRYNTDGSIEILGRIDEQIKINGIRVEIAEITNVIVGHPLIDEAIVIKKERNSRIYLVAYFVKNSNITISEIKNYCRKYLSISVIPNVFVELDKIPINKNGKVDKGMLREPNTIETDKENYNPPRTFNEKKLCNILEGILSVDNIGLQDDFFEHGGHSLLITQLINRISKEFNVKPTIKEIFNNSRVNDMISIVEELIKQPTKQIDSELYIKDYKDKNFNTSDLSIEETEYLLEQVLQREEKI